MIVGVIFGVDIVSNVVMFVNGVDVEFDMVFCLCFIVYVVSLLKVMKMVIGLVIVSVK